MTGRRGVRLGMTGMALALVAGGPVAAEAPVSGRVTTPVHATNDRTETPAHSYTSPSVVVDPDDPLKVYAATVEVRTQRCVFLKSADGGRTWAKSNASPSPDSFPFCTHTSFAVPMGSLAMGREGTLYWAHHAWDIQDGGRDTANRSIFLARSDDEGETWQSTPVRNVRGRQGNDIERNIPVDIVVDTRSGPADVVYVSWNMGRPQPTSPAQPGQPMIAVSSDGGRSFSDPVNVAASFLDDPDNLTGDMPDAARKRENFGGTSPNLALDAAGNLHVSWVRSTSNITPTPPASMYLSRSTDRGRTFTVTEIAPGTPTSLGFTGPVLEWSAAGGADGTLHVMWEGKEPRVQGDRDVLYKRSTDAGRTWSELTTVNDDDPTQLYAQFHPTMSVAPNGRLDAVWWDMRDNAGRPVVDVYYARSDDAGLTWSKNVRVSDRSIDRSFGIWKPGTGGDARQPPGIASSDRLVHLVWDDTRNGDAITETQDLYASAIQYEAIPGDGLPRSVAYVLAAVLGVGVVGLVLLTSALVTGRRRAVPPRPAAVGDGRERVGEGTRRP